MAQAFPLAGLPGQLSTHSVLPWLRAWAHPDPARPDGDDPSFPSDGQFERFMRAVSRLSGSDLPHLLLESCFKCPECASTEPDMVAMVETDPDDRGPCAKILQRITCAKCGYEIPTHLAERWDNMTYAQAVTEWKQIFRPGAPRDTDED